jgi:hypothetical protein
MHYRLGECLSTLRALGYHRSSDLHAPIAKSRHVLPGPTRNGDRPLVRDLHTNFDHRRNPSVTPSFASKRRRSARRPRLPKFWQMPALPVRWFSSRKGADIQRADPHDVAHDLSIHIHQMHVSGAGCGEIAGDGAYSLAPIGRLMTAPRSRPHRRVS